jgi:hypothetical protein
VVRIPTDAAEPAITLADSVTANDSTGPWARRRSLGDARHHAGKEAEQDLGERFVRCFVQAADDAGLPDDADFRAALRSYMEWAVGEVLSYSPHGCHVASNLPVPRWSWEGLDGTGAA